MIAECMPTGGLRNHNGRPGGSSAAGLDVSCRTDRGYLIATLRGALDAAVAPALRECLLRLVHESVGRLIIDLSAVAYADVSCLAVLVGTGRQARLLGGLLRLAAPPVAEAASTLRMTGLDRQLHVYQSVEVAITGKASA
jgi:anti-sigma B factor antagonist